MKRYIFAMLLALYAPSFTAFAAESEEDCPDKILKKATVKGELGKLKINHSIPTATFYIEDKNSNLELVFDYDDRAKIGSFFGEAVTVDYEIRQYWSEPDDECLQTPIITNIRK